MFRFFNIFLLLGAISFDVAAGASYDSEHNTVNLGPSPEEVMLGKTDLGFITIYNENHISISGICKGGKGKVAFLCGKSPSLGIPVLDGKMTAQKAPNVTEVETWSAEASAGSKKAVEAGYVRMALN